MPGKLDDCVRQVMAKGHSESSAWAICKASIEAAGDSWPEFLAVQSLLETMPETARAAALQTYQAARERLGQSHETALAKARDLPTLLGWEDVEHVGWLKKFQAPKTRTVKDVEILRAGVWHSANAGEVEFTTDILKGLVTLANEGIPRLIPLKIGHSSAEFNQLVAEKLGIPVELIQGEEGKGALFLGGAENLRLVDSMDASSVTTSSVLADFTGVPEPIADMIQMGGYRTVSIEALQDVTLPDGREFPMALVGVALLGKEAPAVTEQRGLANVAVFQRDLDQLEARAKGKFSGVFQRAGARIKDMLTFGANPKLAKGEDMDQQWMHDASLPQILERLGMAADATPEQINARLDAILATTTPKPEPEPEPDPHPDPEPKPEAAPAGFSQTQFAALQARVKAQEVELERLRHKDRVNHFSAVSRDWQHIPDKPKLIESLIKLEREAGAEVVNEMVAQHQALAEERKRSALFTQYGTPVQASSGSGPSAYEEEVAKFQQANPAVSKADAYKAVTAAHPELYREYYNSRKIQANGASGQGGS